LRSFSVRNHTSLRFKEGPLWDQMDLRCFELLKGDMPLLKT